MTKRKEYNQLHFLGRQVTSTADVINILRDEGFYTEREAEKFKFVWAEVKVGFFKIQQHAFV